MITIQCNDLYFELEPEELEETLEAMALDAVENTDIGCMLDLFVWMPDDVLSCFIINRVTGKSIYCLFDGKRWGEWQYGHFPHPAPRPIQ